MSATHRLFIVEDNELISHLLTEYLHLPSEREVVGTAASVREALARIPVVNPDLVIVDISLGQGPTGLDLIRSLKPLCPGLACLIHSANDTEALRQAAFSAGALAFVPKGDVEALEAVVNRLLEDAGTRASNQEQPSRMVA